MRKSIRRLKEHYGLIYKVTNLMNKKVYIGQTIFELERRKQNHLCDASSIKLNTYFHKAIKRYKKHNFKWEILGYCDSKEELDEAEITCIKFFNSMNPTYGYNLTKGGKGHSGYISTKPRIISEKALVKIREANKKAIHKSNYEWWLEKYGKEEADKRLKIKINKQKKKKPPRTKEHSENISKSNKGKPHTKSKNKSLTKEHIEKLSKARQGRKFGNQSPEHIANRVASRLKNKEINQYFFLYLFFLSWFQTF